MISGCKIVVCARVGGANTNPLSSAAHFAKQKILNCFLLLQNTKSGGGESEGAAEGVCVWGGNSAAPELQNSALGFSSKKVRILTKRFRQFEKFEFGTNVASPRRRRGSASAKILKGFLKSTIKFWPDKRKFAERSSDKMRFYKPVFFLPPKAEGKTIISNILTA
jgi:hypothetical protein